jgi:hypothetical protein
VGHLSAWWYTLIVTTTRPRHQVTETPGLAHALEVAARRWPEKSTSGQIAALAELGAESVERENADRKAARRRLVEANAGGFEDAYPPGYLEELRQDWPD